MHVTERTLQSWALGLAVLAVAGGMIFACPASAAESAPARYQAPEAQPAEQEATAGEELDKRHKLLFVFGYTHIPGGTEDVESERGIWIPGIGIDYAYRLAEKWTVGAAADIEFGDYLIRDEELNRKNAVILAGLVGYEVMPSWAVFAGPGIEFEQHKNLLVLRLATEYEVELKDDWFLAPGVMVDYKVDFTTWTVKIGAGRSF